MPNAKLRALGQYFGYDSFRTGQEELVDAILAGEDCLGVMPTGAGKSICYQLPAMLLPGITLVISPLISLMKDQVNALTQAGVPAAYLNSSLTERQSRLALENARQGLYRVVYVAPERLEMDAFRAFAEDVEIAMVTVDEAHCISQWGQDFRPSYLGIRSFVESLPRRPILSAFTATATATVREDIVAQLRLENPHVLVTGFDRENLFFEVRQPGNKKAELLSFLSGRENESGIIYCSTRKAVEEVEELLAEHGFSVRRYHAGLTDAERRENQDDFRFDRANVMVATNAFGMGIDKSNVRFVAHYNMPKDIESYYQEAGRAGRDGEPAHCLLLYSGQDVRTALFLIENGRDAGSMDEGSKERDRARLREMTFYCRTGDCLRAYILRYFGERPAASCENCGNCTGDAEREDVTVTAQKILSCVKRMRERYGVKMVLDVLRGSKNERITRLGLDKLSTYGICDDSEKQLRSVVDHLVTRGCLVFSDGEYPVLQLGENANPVLSGTETVEIKRVQETGRAPRERRRTVPQHAGRPIDPALFERLASLRMELARQQNVPAFTVFHDSTLADMCVRLPSSPEDFLAVSGVGQVKLERYGEAFLRVIAEYADSADTREASPAAPEELGPIRAEDVAASEEAVTVSVIADRLNVQLVQRGRKKLSGAKLNAFLVERGYLRIEDGSKVATDEGEALGIETTEREIRGRLCKVCMFREDAQRSVIELAVSELLSEEPE